MAKKGLAEKVTFEKSPKETREQALMISVGRALTIVGRGPEWKVPGTLEGGLGAQMAWDKVGEGGETGNEIPR